ncbi:hypothetical protein LNP74_30555 [Klebsiella pneumoniae subsp. pneumoniae]|nr:hypothetical protein [Klebsiella pneumoniae subsp. pneumoniae]
MWWAAASRITYSTGEPPGVVRAFDVHTGKLAWAWDPGNPALTGVPPEGQTYTRGTPNVWSAMSYDAKLNLIYLPTGNATPDFFGGERTALDDKYSSLYRGRGCHHRPGALALPDHTPRSVGL